MFLNVLVILRIWNSYKLLCDIVFVSLRLIMYLFVYIKNVNIVTVKLFKKYDFFSILIFVHKSKIPNLSYWTFYSDTFIMLLILILMYDLLISAVRSFVHLHIRGMMYRIIVTFKEHFLKDYHRN